MGTLRPVFMRVFSAVFRSKTLFVIGAGASCELGLPSGATLRKQIADQFTASPDGRLPFVDKRVSQAVYNFADNDYELNVQKALDAYIDAAENMRYALQVAPSIDNYLHAHSDNLRITNLGKLGIAESIIQAEAAAEIYGVNKSEPRAGIIKRRKPYSLRFEASWYPLLIQMLVGEIENSGVADIFKNVSFVIFNYDRCVEHILLDALTRYYTIEVDQAARILNDATFLHPYGQIGRLPWQSGAEIPVPLGFDRSFLVELTTGIRTFSEAVEDGMASRVRSAVEEAATIVFLGFGFLEQNIELLTVSNSSASRVFATTKGISDNDVPVIKKKIGRMLNRHGAARAEVVGREGSFHFIPHSGTCQSLLEGNRFLLSEP